MYESSPARPSIARSSPELLGGESYGQSTTTGTDAPDFDNMFSPRAAGTQTLDDDGNSSVATGGGGSNSKDKGRGSYKCGRVSFFVRVTVFGNRWSSRTLRMK
jgi:hypothetical protein